MNRFWEILPVVLAVLFLVLAGYLVFSPAPWRISYPVRLLVGSILVIYAGLRAGFWYKKWKERAEERV